MISVTAFVMHDPLHIDNPALGQIGQIIQLIPRTLYITPYKVQQLLPSMNLFFGDDQHKHIRISSMY